MKYNALALLILLAPAFLAPSFSALAADDTLSKLPALPQTGDFLQVADTMSIATQEELFVRREFFEDSSGEARTSRNVEGDHDELLNLYQQFNGATSRDELERIAWKRNRNPLSGQIAQETANLLAIYEEITLIKLRVLAGEQVSRKTLLNLQVEARKQTVSIAKTGLARALMDQAYFVKRLEGTQTLQEHKFASREQLITELIDLKQANEAVKTEQKNLIFTEKALALVSRNAGQ